jgi:hypothetical protein
LAGKAAESVPAASDCALPATVVEIMVNLMIYNNATLYFRNPGTTAGRDSRVAPA